MRRVQTIGTTVGRLGDRVTTASAPMIVSLRRVYVIQGIQADVVDCETISASPTSARTTLLVSTIVTEKRSPAYVPVTLRGSTVKVESSTPASRSLVPMGALVVD